jgi:hypothetical protein
LKKVLTTKVRVDTVTHMNNTHITADPAFQALVADSIVKINDTVTCNLIAAGVNSDVDADAIYAEALDTNALTF